MHELSQFGKQMSIRMCHRVQLLLATFTWLKTFTGYPQSTVGTGVSVKLFNPAFSRFPFKEIINTL
jgi:hypothetical protein